MGLTCNQDLLRYPAPTHNGDACNQSVAISLLESPLWTQPKLQDRSLDNRHLCLSVVAHDFLDERLPMLANFIQLGHHASSNRRLHSELYGKQLFISQA